jgi:hypothetical protein
MTAPANTLCQTPQGRRALLYLIVPRTRRHFTPAQIASLAETDEIRARTSKKTQEVREAEIRAGASEALVKWVKDKGGLLLRETGASLVVTEIMLFSEGGTYLPYSDRFQVILLTLRYFSSTRQNSGERNAAARRLCRLPLRGRPPAPHRPPAQLAAVQNPPAGRALQPRDLRCREGARVGRARVCAAVCGDRREGGVRGDLHRGRGLRVFCDCGIM